MSTKVDIELLAEAARTGSGSGAGVDLELATTARLWLEVTAVGTGTLAVTVEHSHNGVSWSPLGSFTPRTTAGAERKSFTGALPFVRASWSGATTAYTFSVTGDSVVVYATPDDIKLLGFPAGTTTPGDDKLDEAAEAATDLIDGYLRAGSVPLPLDSWGNDIRRAAAIIAGYDTVSVPVGYNPDAQGDDPWRKRYDDIIRWLERIADGDQLIPTTPPADTSTGRVLVMTSEEPRGW